jgi:membrane protein DedA with SNARE-associated domain
VDFLHIIDQINYVIAHSSAQWWVIPMVSLFCLIDGFFLFLPSETAIVALASISLRTGSPNIWLLMAGAAVGAMIGDNIAYFLGHKLGTTRFKWMRRPRGAKAFAWAGRELDKRGAMLIFTARYIPVGRIAVNFTAGATGFPWRRFVVLDGVAVLTWVVYSASVGRVAGRWVHHNPLLGVGIAIAFAIVIGFIVDHAMKLLHRQFEKRGRLAPRPAPGTMAAQLAARALAEAQAAPPAASPDAVPSGPDGGPGTQGGPGGPGTHGPHGAHGAHGGHAPNGPTSAHGTHGPPFTAGAAAGTAAGMPAAGVAPGVSERTRDTPVAHPTVPK